MGAHMSWYAYEGHGGTHGMIHIWRTRGHTCHYTHMKVMGHTCHDTYMKNMGHASWYTYEGHGAHISWYTYEGQIPVFSPTMWVLEISSGCLASQQVPLRAGLQAAEVRLFSWVCARPILQFCILEFWESTKCILVKMRKQKGYVRIRNLVGIR